MADDTASVYKMQSSVQPVERPLNLIPVGLKEAALDSPTWRATATHISDQMNVIETWLEGYVRAASKLVTEVSSLESLVNTFIAHSMPPGNVSEAVLDHDYALLAMKRYGEGAREFWNYALRGVKKYDDTVVTPIKGFLERDLRMFKDARRNLESSQKVFDATISRYLGQSKTKESSSLREDAFQLHESRKAYLKASMDFCTLTPQLRASLDKLIVKIFSEQWKEMRASREANTVLFQKWGGEMERVRGWSREMESSERAFKKELMLARKQLEEVAETKARPSRELEDYAASTVPYLGGGAAQRQPIGLSGTAKPQELFQKGEKQSWLFLKTVTGKPARTVWSRRWFYVQSGIFGWLIQGTRSGGVEESDKYGVLLCSVRPAFQEERRFCFEVKTKDQSIVLQAETQTELMEWIGSFEMAKRKALEDPASTDAATGVAPGTVDPAFAISPPVAPEFAAKMGDGQSALNSEDASLSSGLAPTDGQGMSASARPSFDVSSSAARRVMSLSRDAAVDGGGGDGERSRDRLMQKLDLHKRSAAASPALTSTATAPAAGGIASLISASHNILPVGPGVMSPAQSTSASGGADGHRRNFTLPHSTLAPSTLAHPPAPTNLSHTAVVVSGERNVSFGGDKGVPSGVMANLWGSTNWGYINRLGDNPRRSVSGTVSPGSPSATGKRNVSVSQDDSGIMEGQTANAAGVASNLEGLKSESNLATSPQHRKTTSLQLGAPSINVGKASLDASALPRDPSAEDEYPNYYPLPLKAQQAQFRMLFPTVPRAEKVVLVFRATWNPNEQQEFPGRVYVTTKDIYFYSHHLGLVLITGVSLASISDVTAAPGRDCDFLYLHLKERAPVSGTSLYGEEGEGGERRRITVKTFLEPLRLLQRRLSFLVHNADTDDDEATRESLEEVLKTLIKMEVEEPQRSSSVESWEDIGAGFSPAGDDGSTRDSPDHKRRERNIKASLRVDGTLGYGSDPAGGLRAKTGREVQKFKLPAHPVIYAPKDMQASVVREFGVSAKALFHVMFGDKSAVFQLLYASRWAANVSQTAWVQQPITGQDEKDKERKPLLGKWGRRFGSPQLVEGKEGSPDFQDMQTIDILNDHLCYVVTNTKFPGRLPYCDRFNLVTKLVITHTAKSRCKLAIYQQLVWHKPPTMQYSRGLIEAQALRDLEADALDLTNVAMDQVSKLGSHSKTNRAVDIFGNIGQQTQVPQIDTSKLSVPMSLSPGARTAPKKISLITLVVQDVFSKLLALVTMIVDLLVAVMKGAIDACSAHGILVAILVVSAAYNSWYGYRDGLTWWREREAGKFMSRLGVDSRGVMMGRAVWLRDVEDFVTPAWGDPLRIMDPGNSTESSYDGTAGKTCKSTFDEHLTASTSSSSALVGSKGSTTARLHRSRNALARYRHDLLVALRVINRVEKDLVGAEWEVWVHAEEQKCEMVEGMLKRERLDPDKGKAGKKGKSATPMRTDEADVLKELGDDFAGYCTSCRHEVEGLRNGTSLM